MWHHQNALTNKCVLFPQVYLTLSNAPGHPEHQRAPSRRLSSVCSTTAPTQPLLQNTVDVFLDYVWHTHTHTHTHTHPTSLIILSFPHLYNMNETHYKLLANSSWPSCNTHTHTHTHTHTLNTYNNVIFQFLKNTFANISVFFWQKGMPSEKWGIKSTSLLFTVLLHLRVTYSTLLYHTSEVHIVLLLHYMTEVQWVWKVFRPL